MLASAFFGTLVPLVYFFIQHKVHKIPGGKSVLNKVISLHNAHRYAAYTTYAFFEWALVLLDVAFDAVTVIDFAALELVVRDVKGTTRGYVQWLPK